MRIAFFNWRCIRNPSAGGAEVYNHQVLKHLARRGHRVTLFTSSFPGSADHEVIDGVEHVRYGGRFMIYAKSFLCYRRYIRHRYDIIIESINGVPFFTTLFAEEKVVPFIHQLTRQNWFSGISYPMAFLGYHLEDTMMRLYSRRLAIVPSRSSEQDLRNLGFRRTTVIHGAAQISPIEGIGKNAQRTVIYLGRLTRSKRVDHVLRAFKLIRDSVEIAKLWVAGSGPEEENLKALAAELGISDCTEFFGRVSEERKAELLSRAHLKLFPAVREGWGLVVLEANACGTPVIGYDVHGLRDSIRPGVNGYLVSDIDSMAEVATRLLKDEEGLASLSESSKQYAEGFSWERTAASFEKVLEDALGLYRRKRYLRD